MLNIQARPATVQGGFVGRWRNHYRAEDMQDALWMCRDLVPSAWVRILDGREVVRGPVRASELRTEYEASRAA